MHNYPFENDFAETLERLYDDDASWAFSCLMKGGGVAAKYLDELTNEGFSNHTIEQYLCALKTLSIDSIVELAVQDGDNFSIAQTFLQDQSTREVFETIRDLCINSHAERRAIGIEIMMRCPGKEFRNEASELICKIAESETNERVVTALAYALTHLDVYERSKYLAKWSKSKRSETRFAIAFSLCGASDDRRAINSLIRLSKDSDDETRNWATFGLGTQTERNTKKIRDALALRLSDPHDETRHEAILGLAKRHDSRVLNALKDALTSKCVWEMALDAATELADPSLLPYLLELQKGQDSWDVLEKAIECCQIHIEEKI